MSAAAGTRVSIRVRVLAASERAPALSEDTSALPYELVVRGRLAGPAGLGEPATVRTAAGRVVHGILDEIEPADTHGFGRPPAALVAADAAISELAETLDG
jgi:2-amino-4-ketopentanoate thiolase alpha subunit